MKNQILEIIKKYPKHYTKIIKNNLNLYEWIISNTLLNNDFSFAEQIYSALYNISNICEYNKIKKFRNINEGFRFCGTSQTCECCKKSVSESVSKSFSKKTQNEIIESSLKRKQTNIEKYGVENVGKTKKAKDNHKNFYNNETLVSETIEKIKQTNIEKYGVDNPMKSDEIKEKMKQINIEKYGVECSLKSEEIRDKIKQTNIEKYGVHHNKYIHISQENLNILYNEELFSNFIKDKTVYDITKKLGVEKTLIYRLIEKYGLQDLYKKRGNTYLESEMKSFLDENNIIYENSNRTILNGKELDFYIPEHNIAIEMNGLYWHNTDSRPNKNYHYNKWKDCQDNGIHLVSIFEDDWNLQQEKICNMLLTFFNKKQKGIPARKTNIQKIKGSNAKIFLNQYHLQGYVSGIHYGAFDGENLIGVMSFGYTRNGRFELSRFVMDNYSHPGLFSKLFKYAQNDLKFTEVVSFSDNTCFTGNVYKINGFDFIQVIEPDYKYIVNKKRVHKSNFKKSNIKNKFPHMVEMIENGMTEREAMDLLGIPRIYDCGKCEWVWKIKC
jgi:hypothetical protein